MLTNIRRMFRLSPKEQQMVQVRPKVSIDFHIRNELVFLLIQNFSPQAAHDVKIGFSRDLLILGDRSLKELSVFSKLRYLAPFREIEVFLNPAERFFQQFEDAETVVEVKLSFRGDARKTFKTTITHDLAIYQDLPTIINT